MGWTGGDEGAERSTSGVEAARAAEKVAGEALAGLKYRMPVPRPDRVKRPRLLRRLSSGSRMLLLIGSPGSGKTTLAAEWASKSGLPVAWVSLDERDDEPRRFMACLWSAMEQALGPSPAGPWPEAGIASPAALMEELLRRLESADAPFLLVLDDYHVVTDGAIHDAMGRLLRAAPERLRVVVTSRIDPPFFLGRIRARGELVVVGEDELRFSPAESREFLERFLGRRPGDEELALLESKAEGWITAIQLAALASRSSGSSLREGLAAERRGLFRYLGEEVFSFLPRRDLKLLRLACVPEEVCPSLLEALGDDIAGESALEGLSVKYTFLVPIAGKGSWYRFHALFREWLIAQPPAEGDSGLACLRLRAARWLEGRGMRVEAMRLALLAGDSERAACLAELGVLEALEREEIGSLVAALEELPERERSLRPWLRMAEAWARSYAGDKAGARRAAEEARLRSSRDDSRLLGYLDALAAFDAYCAGDGEAARRASESALSLLPAEEAAARRHASFSGAMASVYLDDFETAERRLSAFVSSYGEMAPDHVFFIAVAEYVDLLGCQGRVEEALLLCDRVIAAARRERRSAPSTALVHLSRARCLYSSGELDGCVDSAREALALSAAWGQEEVRFTTLLLSVPIFAAAGDFGRSEECLKEARLVSAGDARRTRLCDRAAATRAIRRGDLQGASAIFRPGWVDEDEIDFVNRAEALVLRRRPLEALSTLERLDSERPTAIPSRRLHRLLARAIALEALGRREEARSRLREALETAERIGQMRAVLSRRRGLEPMLREEAESRRTSYLSRLVAMLDRESAISGEPASSRASLSSREREVLRLLRDGRTIDETASMLCLSPETVRTHAKRIYAKLGVHRRLDAARRAGELGLL